jgi:quercetin 2,3-dioxygenase
VFQIALSMSVMSRDPISSVLPLGFPWQTFDPFLFCVHHDDAYPAGNEHMGPAASLAGRDIGQDFAGKDGWRMYHGDTVPGFPQHPHRGFETVTIVRRGLIDHSDSLGAAARFGRGDVQWLTAGKGIVHSEMFPLLDRTQDNPLELFQIWLNLPRTSKMVDPYFSMLWDHTIPRHVARDAEGRETEVTVVAGTLGEARPPGAPPDSWASRSDADVAIWSIRMTPGATWTLPAARAGTNRTLYFFRGKQLRIGERTLENHAGARLRPDVEVSLVAGPEGAELLLLQGRPINEPVVQYGPFVMNTQAEIQQAFDDYRRTQFGGWPWPKDDPVHGRDNVRFARHADGRIEKVEDTAGSVDHAARLVSG